MAGAFAPELDGTMMPYDFAAVDSVAPWGPEMKPVFINYIARHGARYLSSEKKVSELEKTLRANELTPRGDSLLALIERIREQTGDNWGALSPLGIAEEQRLGRELYAIAPELFAEGRVAAVATYVPRVVMSMYEVCHELNRCSPRLEIATAEGPQFNSLLRFFTTDSAYVEYLKDTPEDLAGVPSEPAARLFVSPPKDLPKITMQMYGILQSLGAAGIEGNPADFFTEAEYRRCWEVDNLQHYHQRATALPAESAKELLHYILEHTLDEQGVVARCYFGHAETIMPLFAAMRLPGCYGPQWLDYQVSPLAANLVMVILRAPDGTLHQALRLNGRWICPIQKISLPLRHEFH